MSNVPSEGNIVDVDVCRVGSEILEVLKFFVVLYFSVVVAAFWKFGLLSALKTTPPHEKILRQNNEFPWSEDTKDPRLRSHSSY